MIPTPSFSVVQIALNWHTILLDHLTKAFAKTSNPRWIDYQSQLDYHSSKLIELALKINNRALNNIETVPVKEEVLALQHRIAKLRSLIKACCIDKLQIRLDKLINQVTTTDDIALYRQNGKFQILIGNVEKDLYQHLHSPGEHHKLERMKAILLKFVMQINKRLEPFNISLFPRDNDSTTSQVNIQPSYFSSPCQKVTLCYAHALIDDVTDSMPSYPPTVSLKCLSKIHFLLSRYRFFEPHLDNLARVHARIETLQGMLEAHAISLCASGLDDAFKLQGSLLSTTRPSAGFFQQMRKDLSYLRNSNRLAQSTITSLREELEKLQKGVESAQATNAEAFNFIPEPRDPAPCKPQEGKKTCTSKTKRGRYKYVKLLPLPSTFSYPAKPPVIDAPPLAKPTVVQICVPLHPAVPPTHPSSSIVKDLEIVWTVTHELERLIPCPSIDSILVALKQRPELQQVVFFHMDNKVLSIQQRVLMHASCQDPQMSLDTMKRSLERTHKELICLSFMMTVDLKGVHLAQKKFKQYFISMNLWETYEQHRYRCAEKMSLNIAAIEAMKCVLQFLQVEFGYRKGSESV